MNQETRLKFTESFFGRCKELMGQKGPEYTNDKDTLSNFKQAAEDTGTDPKTVCWIYLYKHLEAIRNYVKSGKTSSDESIEGRLMDAANYMNLMAQIIWDEQHPRNDVTRRELFPKVAVDMGIGLQEDPPVPPTTKAEISKDNPVWGSSLFTGTCPACAHYLYYWPYKHEELCPHCGEPLWRYQSEL